MMKTLCATITILFCFSSIAVAGTIPPGPTGPTGATGDAGAAGPNVIDASTTTTLTGLALLNGATVEAITDSHANWDTGYSHSTVTSGNPHSVSASDVGLGSVENTALSTWAGSSSLNTSGALTATDSGSAQFTAKADANAYTTFTQADGAGLTIDCTTDGAALITLQDAVSAAGGLSAGSGDLTVDIVSGDPTLTFKINGSAKGTISADDDDGDEMVITSPTGVYVNPTGGTFEVNGTVKIGAYTLPATDGNNGDVLETDGVGGVTWQAPSAVGATALDDIGDPDGVTEINLAGNTIEMSSTLNGGGEAVLNIRNTTADLTTDTTLIEGSFVDNLDANAYYVRFLTNTGTEVLSINNNGNIYCKSGFIGISNYSNILQSSTSTYGYMTLTASSNDTSSHDVVVALNSSESTQKNIALNSNWRDVDTQIRGITDSTYLLYADAGLGSVGIGAAPSTGASLEVTGNISSTGTVKIGAYTLPATDGNNGDVLSTNGAGVVTWGAPSGAATAYDDIGDPDASGSIAMGEYTGTYTSATDGWGGILITNTVADVTVASPLLTLGYTDSNDAQIMWLKCFDANTDLECYIGENTAGTSYLGVEQVGSPTDTDTYWSFSPDDSAQFFVGNAVMLEFAEGADPDAIYVNSNEANIDFTVKYDDGKRAIFSDASLNTLTTDGNFQIGASVYDCGTLTMIKGAQTSDPTATVSLSADGVGTLTIATTNGSNGDIVLHPSGGSVEIIGDLYPDADGTRDIGTQTTAQWANVWSDAINGADFTYQNNYRTMELEKFEGYPEGVAITSPSQNPPLGTIVDIMPGKPLFAVCDDFIEYQGVRFTKEQLETLLKLVQ